jgi:hypothetical protein
MAYHVLVVSLAFAADAVSKLHFARPGVGAT